MSVSTIHNPSAGLRWTAYLAAALLTAAVAAASAQAPHAPPYRVAAIQAKLFYEHRGTFSEDVLANPRFVLRNVFIGEGDAKEPSTSTLVLVVISGQPGAYEPSRRVEITATRSRTKQSATVLRRIMKTGILSKQGKFYVPLWLYDTGAAPIAIQARLLGQGRSAPLRKVIDFQSGE